MGFIKHIKQNIDNLNDKIPKCKDEGVKKELEVKRGEYKKLIGQ